MSFEIRNAVDIDAPADVVWRVLIDFSSYGEWNPFQVECSTTLVPGEPIDMLVQLGDGDPTPQSEVIVAVDPGRSFSYRMKPAPLGLLRSLRTVRVVDAGEGRSRFESEFTMSGLASGLLKAKMGRDLGERFASVAAALGPRAETLAQH